MPPNKAEIGGPGDSPDEPPIISSAFSPAGHQHWTNDIKGLDDWKSATERVIANQQRDIETLKKVFLIMLATVCFLAIVMLVVVG